MPQLNRFTADLPTNDLTENEMIHELRRVRDSIKAGRRTEDINSGHSVIKRKLADRERECLFALVEIRKGASV